MSLQWSTLKLFTSRFCHTSNISESHFKYNNKYTLVLDSQKELTLNGMVLLPDKLGPNGLFRLLPLIVCLQLKDVPIDELLSVRPEGELQRKRLLARDLGCQTAC